MEPTDVGPDPLKWIERLIDVNAGARFSVEEKLTIQRALLAMYKDVKNLKSLQVVVGR